jgi:hypothetical protein
MAIKVQGRIFVKGKSFWSSGGGVPVTPDPPTSETYAIALEEGDGIFTAEDNAGYVATEEAPANTGTPPDTSPTEPTTPTTPSEPDDAVLSQDGSQVMAQNGTDYISY